MGALISCCGRRSVDPPCRNTADKAVPDVRPREDAQLLYADAVSDGLFADGTSAADFLRDLKSRTPNYVDPEDLWIAKDVPP